MTQEEFDALYAATATRLVGQLYAMTGDLTEAQDVVQEAFVRAWQRRRELSMVGSHLVAYLRIDGFDEGISDEAASAVFEAAAERLASVG